MTAIEALADFYSMGLTVENYRHLRKRSIEQGAPIWPAYNQLEAAKKALRPPLIVTPRPDLEVKVTLQSVCQLHIDGIFLDEDVKARFLSFSRDPDVRFQLVGKVGADGAGAFSIQRHHSEEGSNIFASTFATISLLATKDSQFAAIFKNKNVNSNSAHSYLRVKFEKEVKVNSTREGARLLGEVDSLRPILVEGIPIKLVMLPVLVDGKVKAYWSDVAQSSCFICGATEKELAMKWLPKFLSNPEDRIRFGLSPLHALIQTLRWLIKGATYRDCRAYACVGKDNQRMRDLRIEEMEVSQCFLIWNESSLCFLNGAENVRLLLWNESSLCFLNGVENVRLLLWNLDAIYIPIPFRLFRIRNYVRMLKNLIKPCQMHSRTIFKRKIQLRARFHDFLSQFVNLDIRHPRSICLAPSDWKVFFSFV